MGARFDEGRLGDKVTTVEMSRGTNLSWHTAGLREFYALSNVETISKELIRLDVCDTKMQTV